ncbi:MAG: hypothetical protein L3J19_06915 [Sulfurimonas sp.]|nr:hypothetical protein [Sulfurimonas sp.]
MKIEELFEKAEKFFGMEIDEQRKNTSKREELIVLLQEKISSMKGKIRECTDDDKREELKKETEILQQLKKDCEIDTQDKDM